MFTEKLVLVTGASRGIGRATAELFSAAGATVIGTATSEKGAESISAYIKAAGSLGKGFVLDVTDNASIEQLMQELKTHYQMPDILINNAAVTEDNLMLRLKEEMWDAVIDTNLNSVFRMTKACLRTMMKARWGRIITIGSIVGSTGNMGQANYAAAKAGLIGFSKSLALEIASRNVTVNVVSPGFVNTDMTQALSKEQRDGLLQHIPMGRVAEPKEIAEMVLFLASDKASYITGQTLHVNGGMHME
jgi:3-oxoacyl-[acyl-carrier protein] reductase